MQRDVVVKSRTLGGSSDLTLLAPIRPGLVDALESVTYKTRVQRTLEALHLARAAAHEHALARLLSDAVERVGVIHSVRVAVLEPQDQLLLAVTFDGPWEAYIRLLWHKVGPLLDTIFCSTVGYVAAHDHSLDEWLTWVRSVQVETGFFYGPPDVTARDVVVHRRLEAMRQRGLDTVRNELGAVAPTAEEAVRRPWGEAPDDPPVPPLDAFTQVRRIHEQTRHGLQALAGLYRLTDLFRPGTPDGEVLRLAALSLLQEFVALYQRTLDESERQAARVRFGRQLDWLFVGQGQDVAPMQVPPLQLPAAVSAPDLADVQGGILRGQEPVTHGLVVLLAFSHPAAAAAFLAHVTPQISRESSPASDQPGQPFVNLAFTLAGLRTCGLPEDALDRLPEDFRQGMAARAGQLGDWRLNHPRRWQLPRRFVEPDRPPDEARIDLDAVHAVLQLRCAALPGQEAAVDYWEPAHPLQGTLRALLVQGIAGLQVLAVQAMKRQHRLVDGQPRVMEHFGYADGEGQPDVLGTGSDSANRVPLGEVLLGQADAGNSAHMDWLRNGSFLVLRTYRQNVARFRAAVDEAARALQREAGLPQDDLPAARREVQGKLMGRYPDGTPLVERKPTGGPNAFDYAADPRGERCPLHAHIRRAHPRGDAAPGARLPRLLRRGMAYGPPYDDDPQAERGLVFMAYNASLSEQFEVVQRWLAGGNSTGASSGTACPIVGVAAPGQPRHFRFTHAWGGTPGHGHVQLEDVPPPFDEPEPLTRLAWGLYLFTPGLSVLQRLQRHAADAAAVWPAPASVPWRVERGRAMLAELREVEQHQGPAAAVAAWKAAIEDPQAIDRLDSASLWAAIRQDHGGLLRTPYGVLVASSELLTQVFRDRDRYSVQGQRERMRASIGDISLGQDGGAADGPAYWDESAPINDAIARLDGEEVFQLARRSADGKITAILDDARQQALQVGSRRWEVSFDAREVLDEVLADLSEAWFGLRGSPHLARGGADWAWQEGQPPVYPGHFTALSRYMFQPHPGPVPVELGQRYGQALTQAMRLFVAHHRPPHALPVAANGQPAPLAAAIFTHPTRGADDAWVASTLVGVLMGFTPTLIGAVLNVLNEWHRDGRFAQLRAACAGRPLHTLAEAAALIHAPLAAAAQMRPMPQIGWRVVRSAHRLGPDGPHGVQLQPGDVVVTAMVSGTQQALAEGQPDGRLMFGGVREEPHAPTHACPGYHQGIAAMLGTLSALLCRAEDLRQLPQAQVFEVRGEAGPAQPAEPPTLRHAEGLAAEVACPAGLPAAGSRAGLVLGWGDSWLSFLPGLPDLRVWLAQFGYHAPADYCGLQDWPWLARMVASRDAFRHDLQRRFLPAGLRAIVLSAGGNDSVGEPLQALLCPRGSGPEVIHPEWLAHHLQGLQQHYLTLIEGIRVLPDGQHNDVPIFLHGYDHPVPVQRGHAGWIRTPFWRQGYVDEQAPEDSGRCDLPVATAAMRELIDALNDTIAQVAQASVNVHYVDLRGTVAQLFPDDPAAGWFDNMHPVPQAWRCMAARIAHHIETTAA